METKNHTGMIKINHPVSPQTMEKVPLRKVCRIEIRESKDFIPERPWVADMIFTNGYKWVAWCYGYKTMEELVDHCQGCIRSYRGLSKIKLVY